jgi:molybdopterin synthase catalytic subunit
MEDDVVEVTAQALSLERYTDLVTRPAAGAVSAFIGTTRDNFAGKHVLHLEYEAYKPMAIKMLQVRLQAALVSVDASTGLHRPAFPAARWL